MTNTRKQILELCKQPQSRQYIAAQMGMTPNAVHKWITKLKDEGYMAKVEGTGGSLAKYKVTDKYFLKINGGFTICGVRF
jgi:predicted transcriptional regulator